MRKNSCTSTNRTVSGFNTNVDMLRAKVCNISELKHETFPIICRNKKQENIVFANEF